jgi:hypothetical protein
VINPNTKMIRRTGHLALLLFAWPLSAADPPPLALFVLPKVELKPAASTNHVGSAAPAETSTQSQKTEVPATEDFSLIKETPLIVSESSVQSFEAMNGGSVLSAVERPPELGGAAGWLSENVWDPVFAPEVIKVGKVHMSGGIVAAVKRKNPFCLLHPLVFVASW